MSDTRPQGQPDEAMVDLLIKQVTEGLSPAEQRALDVHGQRTSRALICGIWSARRRRSRLAGSTGGQPLPAALSAQRIAQQAAEHFAPSATSRT